MQSESIEFDYSIPLLERAKYVLSRLPDPYLVMVGDISVSISFTENTPDLQARMYDLLCRKICG